MQSPRFFTSGALHGPVQALIVPEGSKAPTDRKARFYRCQPSIPRSFLVGETTRRKDLNLDRGCGIRDAQHTVRKREPQQGNLPKVAHSRTAPPIISA